MCQRARRCTDVEIAQARDLDIKCLAIRGCRTDLHARHVAQADLRLELALAPCSASDAVDPVAIDLLRIELQLQPFAHHTGKKATHRVLLPARCLHHCGNRRHL